MKIKIFIMLSFLIGAGVCASDERSTKRSLRLDPDNTLRAPSAKAPKYTVDYYKRYLDEENPSFNDRVDVEAMMKMTLF